MSQSNTNNTTKIDSLEIVGAGVSVETFGNYSDDDSVNLWKAVQANNGYIISSDPDRYPTHFRDALPLAESRQEAAIQTAMHHFMDSYPIPIAIVGTNWQEEDNVAVADKIRAANANCFIPKTGDEHYTVAGKFPGLNTQRGQVLTSYLNDNPDKLWNILFATFDEHADIPALGVGAVDGLVQRAFDGEHQDDLTFGTLADQACHPKTPRVLSDSCTMLAMVSRSRIDRLRQYSDLVQDAMTSSDRSGYKTRTQSEFNGWKKVPGRAFETTPFIATPWTRFQEDQYDHLQLLGRVYRPQNISYLNPSDGKSLNAAERNAQMEIALQAALAPIGGKMPARVFYDYGSIWKDRAGSARFQALSSAIKTVDPEFDLTDPKRGYDLAIILGDLGAGSPFVAVALAIEAAQQSGGATLVVNMRRNDGATLLLITPPSAVERQFHSEIERPFWPRFYGFN
ncbi:type VI lipase adapter Tla3 domain-containing protein [Glaciimonas soli]|uniref:DUF2875 domain-containing protein n=1 Tax=Glaciimonas soli TaxID=2590999 RepID=A0A843YWP9_9BURK|nr:DUF2875 family protein [Glaciimonas soli]MQR01652.1 DUF2875 domain-containing protein [Glaciimonas soli]